MAKGARLPHTIRAKDGTVIVTIQDATNYMLALPPNGRALWNSWQYAAKLIMDNADPEAIAKQIEYALLLDGKLDVSSKPIK